MKIKRIRMGLSKLQPALKAFGAEAMEGELAKIIKLMADYDDLSVSEFCMKARAGLERQDHLEIEISKPRGDTVVCHYVSLLREAEFDDNAFGKAVTRLGGDKKVRFKELTEIAKQFNGYELKYRNKLAALNEITTKRNADRRTEHKFKMLAEW